jgi:RND superfamily putative drug exporter
MHLAGPAMWWMPAWLDKRLPHLHIERPDVEDEPADAPEERVKQPA